jgi:hypothetical protein
MAVVLLGLAEAARATPHPITLQGRSPDDLVQVQFINSRAQFISALSLVTPSTAQLAACAGVYAVVPGDIQDCVFDESVCASDHNPVPPGSPGGACVQPVPNDYTCECYSQRNTSIGTIAALTGNPTATSVDVDFKLNIDRNRDLVRDNVLDSDPSAVRITPLDAAGSAHLLEWEDSQGFAGDYNDLVVIVRLVPAACIGGNPPAYCSKGALTSENLTVLSHLTLDSAELPGCAPMTEPPTGGVRLDHTYLNFTDPKSFALCPELNVALPAAVSSGASELNRNQHYSLAAAPSCAGTQSGFPTLAFARSMPDAPMCPPATPPVLDARTISGAMGATPASNEVQLPEGASYPYTSYDAAMAMSASKLFSPACGTSSNDLRRSVWDPILHTDRAPLTLYYYPLSNGEEQFQCPAGPLVRYGEQASGDARKPLSPLIQTNPAVLAINSPVTVNIPTVPIGSEDPNAVPTAASLVYSWSDNLAQLDPTAPPLVGFITTTFLNGFPLGLDDRFFAGGAGVRGVKATLSFPNSLPEGYQGRLVAYLKDRSTQTLIITTYSFAKDHTPPVLAAAQTVRTQTGVVVNATLVDTASGVGDVWMNPVLGGNAQPTRRLHGSSGDYYDPTLFAGVVAAAPGDVISVDLAADDTHANAIAPVRLPVANNGGSRSVECNSPTGATVLLDGSSSTGPTDVSVSYTWTGPFGSASGVSVTEILSFGSNSVTLALQDGRGYTGEQTALITVGDTTGPSLSVSADPACVWPPNHKAAVFALGADLGFAVTDVCDPNPRVRIVNVTRSDGAPVTFDNSRFCAFADKNTSYTVTVEARDSFGNTTVRTTTVQVPSSSQSGCVQATSSTCPF